MRSAGRSTQEISRHLNSIGVHATFSTIRRHYKERPSRKRKPRKITEDIVTYPENATQQNDELSSCSVKKQLWRDRGVQISDRSIRTIRQKLGWKYRKTQNCPMIRDKNKELRLQQAQKWIAEKEAFHNVIFTDETTVALDRFATMSFRKRGRYVSKPKPKHPLKVHVWGAISRFGPGPIVIFEGIMDRSLFESAIIKETAAPYIRENF